MADGILKGLNPFANETDRRERLRRAVETMTPDEIEHMLADEALSPAAEYSEIALARVFTDKYEERLRYTAQWGQWHYWDAGVWRPDVTCKVFDRARIICQTESERCGHSGLCRKLSTSATGAAVERLARWNYRLAMKVDKWDANPWLLNTPAGVIDLHTTKLRPTQRDDYMSKITAVGPGTSCPLWLDFLKRITNGDRDLEAYLQRMCGYALTGSIREEAMFFLYGTGGNGKGTFLSPIEAILGDYAKTAPIEAFVESKSEQHPTALAGLRERGWSWPSRLRKGGAGQKRS
jgi:putative DNA primase/helicase